MTQDLEHRRGQPSPLVFHLGVAAAAYLGAIALSAKARDPDFPWHPDVLEKVSALTGAPDPLSVASAAARRLTASLSGLRKWQNHPFRRPVPSPRVLWQRGSSRLLDYSDGQDDGKNAPVVFVIPSLINRSYILDLLPDNSLLRYLRNQGLRPVLLDWGAPTTSEYAFDFDTYIADRAVPAFEIAKQIGDTAPSVLGYCMGGTLAAGMIATGLVSPSKFVTLGSPWDFSAYSGIASLLAADSAHKGVTPENLRTLEATFGVIPPEVFQWLFASITPLQAAIKFRKFNEIDMDSAIAHHFVAVEDWLADGIAMAYPAAKNLLIDWNTDNVTAGENWSLLGKTVVPADIRSPTLVVCGARDTIAPPDVTTPMARAIPQARILRVDTGHVGMITGRNAAKTVWEPVAGFLLEPAKRRVHKISKNRRNNK